MTLGACVVTPEEHNHTFAEDYTTNATHHWRVATCEHTTEATDFAPHSFVNNKCEVCGYEKKVEPPKPSPADQAEEKISEFLLTLGDNFSLAISPSKFVIERFGLSQEYCMLVDGNKIYAYSDSDKYYVEDIDGTVYLYTQDEEYAWHKKIVTEEFGYPSNTGEILTDFLGNVNWETYDEDKGIANGYFEVDNNEYLIVFIFTEDGAKIEIYSVQYILGIPYPFIPVGHAVICDIGSTTVTLPENAIDDTEQTDPETPPTEQPDASDTDQQHVS
ncbi:MAG: hypothetical protein J1F68_05490 [Clostridiales bacterium]|nr:hypothetical protein [Clostridiales bacterium]